MSGDTALHMEEVTKTFGAEDSLVTAVDRVSLSVSAGELLMIMGPSGSGKTTLLAMCGGLLRPSSGRIWLKDQELTKLTEKQLPAVRLRRVGFIFQSANLLTNLTASENVRLVLEEAGLTPAHAFSKTQGLLDALGVSHRFDAMPEQLSGGERQRVAIARALANEPGVLLADEPTANLDSTSGQQLMQTLRVLTKEQGKSVVVVSHDHRIENVADRVLWLEDGRVADGRPRRSEA